MNFKDILSKIVKGKKLSYHEIDYVITNFTNDNINEEEMSKFIMEIYKKGLTFKETLYLTNSMIKSGEILDFSKINKTIVDKHSTGGVGDKITLIVAPIVAANGLGVAKMSGRSLGLTGGTIDKLESIEGYNVNLDKNEFINQVNNIGVSVISQTDKIAVADKKIYALRDKIGAVDSIPLIASSIMSKKIASGANIIIIDLKVGNGAFMKDIKSAKKLAKTMIKIGKKWNKKVVVILTDMNAPLGNSVGNALEIKETIDFLNGTYQDKRLKTLSSTVAAYMISKGKNISINKAYTLANETLENGTAYNKFEKWIHCQGGNLSELKDNAKTLEVFSDKDGYIDEINAEKIAIICNELGSGRSNKRTTIDYGVGIVLNKALYDKVKKDELLATIYYNETKEKERLVEQLKQSCKIIGIKPKEKNIIISIIS